MPEFRFNSSEKIYLQIMRDLERRIAKLEEREPLPSYRSLASEYGVSVTAIQHAFRELKKQEIVIPQQGRRSVRRKVSPENRLMRRFGFIHPFHPDFPFGRSLVYYANAAFGLADLNVSVTVRSSLGEPEKERVIAENMVYNGIQGILISPADIQRNGDFFEELSKEIPVVMVDQFFPKVSLPGVMINYTKSGVETAILASGLVGGKGKEILLLLDDAENTSIAEWRELFIQTVASKKGKMRILRFPLLSALRKSYSGDFSLADSIVADLEQHFKKYNTGVVVSWLAKFIELFMLEERFYLRHKELIHVTLNSDDIAAHSRYYYSGCVHDYSISYPEYFQKAAELILYWDRQRRRPKKKIQICFKHKR